MSTVHISEFLPNPTGTDPAITTVELSGTPGEAFSGVLVAVESDAGGANPGDINGFEAVSGTFDANGLLTVDIDDIENPSFTVVLAGGFTGSTGTDIDPDDDGVPDDLSAFGEVFDAIGVPDEAGDESLLYGTDFGGTDFTFTGDEPRLVFREASVGALFAVNDPDGGQVFDTAGVDVGPGAFDSDPTVGTDTFGVINPALVDAVTPALISELLPNPSGADPATTTIELSGAPGASFTGVIVSIESDSGANPGDVNDFEAVSGTFDTDGLLTVEIADIENPSFTLGLASAFTGDTDTDIDADDDGVPDDLSAFGTILDAVGVPDTAGDEAFLYGTDLGGTDFAFTGDEPRLVFRESSIGAFFAVNDPDDGQVFDTAGVDVTPAAFDSDPTAGTDTFGAVNPAFMAPAAPVLISEFLPNPTGTDPATTMLELSGTAGAEFSGVIVNIESDGSSDPGDINSFEAVSGTFDGDGLLTVTIDDIENPSFTVVLADAFTGTGDTDIDADDDGIADDLSAFGAILDAVGVPDTGGDETFLYGGDLGGTDFAFTGDEPRLVFRSGSVGELFAVNDPDGGLAFNTAGIGFGAGSFDVDPTAGTDTFGAINPIFNGIIEPPGEATIAEIQGAGHISPFLAATVSTTGIVTALAGDGFYIQDPVEDGDDATSEGIFVDSSATVAVGDAVAVTGTVVEDITGTASDNLSVTEIAASTVAVTSSGNPVPAPVVLGVDRTVPTGIIDNDSFSVFDPAEDGIDFYESLEGMLVTALTPTVADETNFFGEINTVPSGVGATGLNDRGGITIGVGATGLADADFNPELLEIDDTLPGVVTPEVLTGDTLADVTGVIDYSFDRFELLALESPLVTSVAALEPETTALVPTDSQLTIAAYNVLNLDPNDTGDDDTDVADGRFALIADQIVNNLGSPDIVALQEIQDNDGAAPGGATDVVAADVTLGLLADEVNALLPGTPYAFIDNTFITDDENGGEPGGNIRVAFLYNTERVDLVPGSETPIIDPAVLPQGDPANPFDGSRLPLAADFEFNGETVTVISVHNTSRGGSTPLFGSIQPQDIGGEDTREDQVAAINEFIDGILADDPDANVVVGGDLNAFQFEDQAAILDGSFGGGTRILANLTELLPDEERYTFIFDGNSQALDHVFASEGLVGGFGDDLLTGGAEYDVVHLNAEFPDVDERASDHDPVVARFVIEPTTVVDTTLPPVQNAQVIGGGTGLQINANDPDDFVITPDSLISVLLGVEFTLIDPTVVGVLDNIEPFAEDRVEGLIEFAFGVSDALDQPGLEAKDIVQAGGGLGLDGNDTVTTSAGSDTIDVAGGDDRVFASRGDDSILGGAGDDELFGQAGDDTIDGGAGDDELFGGSGTDLLIGGAGDDELIGNRGADTFRFDLADYAGVGPAVDVIIGFRSAEGDQLLLEDGLTFTSELVTDFATPERFFGFGTELTVVDAEDDANTVFVLGVQPEDVTVVA